MIGALRIASVPVLMVRANSDKAILACILPITQPLKMCLDTLIKSLRFIHLIVNGFSELNINHSLAFYFQFFPSLFVLLYLVFALVIFWVVNLSDIQPHVFLTAPTQAIQ